MVLTKILMVEDDVIIARDCKERLTKMGYGILDIRRSGEEAIEKAEALKPDLILMDITTEGKKDGIQAAEEIEEKYGIPIVYLTAHSHDITIEKYFKKRSAHFLIKPVRDEALSSTIKKALS